MPSFGKTSTERLSQCHPELILLFSTVVLNWDCAILCGHRGEVEQSTAYRLGNSRVQWPDSKHNRLPSWAVDVAPWSPELGRIDWDDHIGIALFAGKVIETHRHMRLAGELKLRLRWGGDWDGDGRNTDQRFNDLVHFELIPVGES